MVNLRLPFQPIYTVDMSLVIRLLAARVETDTLTRDSCLSSSQWTTVASERIDVLCHIQTG